MFRRVLSCAVIILCGCASPQYIYGPNVKGLIHDVCDRDDAYVTSDTRLDPNEVNIFLLQTKLLRRIVDEASEPVR